jgi:hypothetical protein
MKRDQIISFLQKNRTEINKFGVKSLAIFGSVARNEATLKSDLDLLVEFDNIVTFDRYMDLKFFLEDNLNCSVDLVTKKMLKPQLKEIVEREAIYVS